MIMLFMTVCLAMPVFAVVVAMTVIMVGECRVLPQTQKSRYADNQNPSFK
jgi:ABC-type dipeptide/oligopeptide/nickel transport system permease component